MRNLTVCSRKECSGLFDKPRIFCLGGHELYVIEGSPNSSSSSSRLIGIKVNETDDVIIDPTSSVEQLVTGVDEVDARLLNGVFQTQFVPTTESIYMATDEGEFLQFCRSWYDGKIHEMFKSEQGIAQFAVSPDSRLVAIMTRRKTLLVLTLPDLECIAQHDLLNGGTGDGDRTLDPTGNAVSIAWRHDSRYFAVNFPLSNDGTGNRIIKVYDDTGALYSTTEECHPLLNACLEWQPSGGLIAAFGKSPHGKVVFLFELNGLRRADFSPYDDRRDDGEQEEVQGLEWNSASNILAIKFKYSVELWTRSNYVWMKKKCLRAERSESCIQMAKWDVERPNRIHLVYEGGLYTSYDLAFSYISGNCCGSALTISWNGRHIYCFPFRDFCAPPPYGLVQTSLQSDVACVLLSNFWDGFLTVDVSGTFYLFEYKKGALQLVQSFTANDFAVQLMNDWIWVNKSTVASILDGNIILFELDETSKCVRKIGPLDHENHLPVSASPIKFTRIYNPDTNQSSGIPYNVIVAEAAGINSVIFMKIQSSRLEAVQLCKLPLGCSNLKFIKFEESEFFIAFAHDAVMKKLYASWTKDASGDPVKISVDCTSVEVFGDNLLLTTSGSLEIYTREALIEILEQNSYGKQLDDNVMTRGKYTRKIEKGSVIVTCCLNKMLEPALVLQVIPRGNLETIFPRPLLISSLRVTLRENEDKFRYEKIMTALRRHRVDYRVLMEEMKLLEKKDPNQSLEKSLQLMIDQVQDSHSLVLLVTDLDEDYIDCITIIKNLLEKLIVDEELSRQNKRRVNLEEAYLASLAKLGLLEEALKSRLIEREDQDKRDLVTHRVKFLSYYCDNPDILFDTAIGTYDLNLASLVADCLGKDPKEYLPVLDGFQNLSHHRRLFKIDERLRRFSKAIIHLIDDESVQHDEVLKYMERHRLFSDSIEYMKTALGLPELASKRTRDDMSLLLNESRVSFGRYLEEHGRLKEACILYRGGGEADKAINSAVKCGSWETALEIFFSSYSDPEKLTVLCGRILEQLEESKNYTGAAHICESYLRDNSRAVGFYVRSRNWPQARLLAQKDASLKEKCVQEVIRPKLEECALEQIEVLDTLKSDLMERTARLRTVKAVKLRRQLEGDDGDGDSFSDTDSISTTSSMRSGSTGSNSTGKTHRSSKNRRKFERKLQSMREGSAYEDLAITAHLWNCIDKIQQEMKPYTSELLEALWSLEMNSLALSLGNSMDNLVAESNSIVLEVWQNLLTDELLETKYRVSPPEWSTSWDKLCLHEPSSKAVKNR